MDEIMMDDDDVQFCCKLPAAIDSDSVDIVNRLPKIKTKITSVELNNHMIYLKLFTACTNVPEVKMWQDSFEEITKTSYSITGTKKTTGQYVNFKQYLHCRHNTKSSTVHASFKKCSRTRNTNCPSKITFTLHALKKRPSRGKDISRNELVRELPCEIDLVLTHNHNIGGSAALAFRKVSEEVREKLISLFSMGHSPATALHTIKTDIYLDSDDYEKLLVDRKHCPDYNYTYNLYMKHFKKKYGPLEFDSAGKDFLKKRLQSYNEQMEDNCAQMILHESDYVICICSPFSKRVHQQWKSASEMVFMDSSGTIDHDGSRIFILLAHSECGGLPLAVIVTSSESSHIIQIGFQLLKDMLGDTIFGGHKDGPQIFLTGDSSAEQAAIKTVWKNSKCLLSVFHGLQAVWRWLMKGRNNIPEQHRYVYFRDFKSILYSGTVDECFQNYEIAKNKVVHENYACYLKYYWERRELWALPYRNSLLTRGNNTNNISEAAMRVVKDKILNRIEAFNVVQMIDFILTKFVTYYEIQLLDAANNCQQKSKLDKTNSIYHPPEGLLEQISVLSGNIMAVPSETTQNLIYTVNLDALTCTCPIGNTGKMCKHMHWAAIVRPTEQYNIQIDDINIRKSFYYIATGTYPTNEWFQPLYHGENRSVDQDEFDMQTETTSLISNSPAPADNDEGTGKEKIIEEQARAVSNYFYDMCVKHGQNSPNDVGLALEKMMENMGKIRTTAAFVSSCSNFALDYRLRNRRSTIPVQPTALSGRKIITGGRPRAINKNKAINKKRRHKLVSVVDKFNNV